MAVSAQSAAFRSAPGYAAPVSTTSFTPPSFTTPSLPSVPAIDDARAPNAAMRAWLGQQLGQLPAMYNANLTNIRTSAKQALAGYGGWKFREDNPNTPQREDLVLDFNSKSGPGEREKSAMRGVRAQQNAQGMLYSSGTNQNIGTAVQRLSLEAQQIANQYSSSLLEQHNNYAGQVAQITGQFLQLYGQDSQWLLENPPPTPEPPPPSPQAADPYAAWPAKAGDGSPIIWKGKAFPNIASLQAQHPGQQLGVRQAGDGSYVVVIGTGSAQDPRAFNSPYLPGRPGNTRRH